MQNIQLIGIKSCEARKKEINNKMNETELLKNYSKSDEKLEFQSKKYGAFAPFINSYHSGEGLIGENSYLILWDKDELEELNDAYEVKEFLSDCILIGSDGGDTGYGINIKGFFFSVPFIGMSNETITILGKNYIEFLENLYNV